MRLRTTILAASAITGGGLLLTGCGQAPWEDSLRDLETAQVRDPGSVVLWNNVDKHPNVVRLCLDGVAFATTAREFTSLMRVPEWDPACIGVQDRVMK